MGIRGDGKYMKKCVEIKVTEEENVYIELRVPYEKTTLRRDISF